MGRYNKNPDDIRFDRVFELFISSVFAQIEIAFPGDESVFIAGKIGEVDFNAEIRKAGNGRSFYVNTYRINKNEIEEVLRQALCFTNQQHFDNFLKTVSKCSLAYHRILAEGIKASTYDPFLDCVYHVKLPLVRRKNKNFIVLGKDKDQKEFRVKNTNSLINLQHNRKRYRNNHSYSNPLIDTLLNPKTVEGLTIADIKFIIKEGKKAYEDAEKKSIELLNKTIKNLGIAQETHHGVDGYVISGKKNKYFLSKGGDAHTNNCEIRTLPDWKYVCVIDKSLDQAGEDKLVNRMYALKNDTLVANQIGTLR
jgi:hypothetical protein